MNTTGSFRGTVLDGAVSASSGGFAQLVLKVHADEMYDDSEDAKEWGDWGEFAWEPNEIDDRDITIYVMLFGEKGATFNVDTVKKIFGWDGQSLGALDALAVEGVKVQWQNKYHTYNDVTKIQADFISEFDAPPGGSLKKLDAKGLAELDAKFSKFLKGEVKPEKAATGGRKRQARKTATEATTETPAKAEEKTEAPVEEKTTKRTGRGKKKVEPPVEKTEAPAEDSGPPEENVLDNAGPCTKAEAWKGINKKIPDGVTEAQVASAWTKVIKLIAGDRKQAELSDEEWGAVKANVLDDIGIPF
jgi:hypothetical protein